MSKSIQLTIWFQNGPDSQCANKTRLKLRKNRRIENKWGLMYCAAVEDAVFGQPCPSYMPTEPSASLSEEIVECDPLYICEQCKDWLV